MSTVPTKHAWGGASLSVVADRLELRPERGRRAAPVPPLHVLHLLESSSGGVARYVAAVAEGLTARGWRISVAGPAGVRKLASWCREHDVSVIHGHQAKAGLLSGLVGRVFF